MAKITFIIEGVSLCYLPNDNIWRVIFPFDNCHKLVFEPLTANIPLAQAARVIDFIVVGGKNTSSEGPQFKKLFNLTEKTQYQAHVNGIKTKQQWEQHGVLLKIPNAKMSLVKETKSRYQLKLNGQIKHDFGKLGHSAKAEIELNQGGTITINVPGNPNFPKTFTENDDGKIITFDNDCNLIQPVGDLELLYDFIIEDKLTISKKFEIDRHPDDKPITDAFASDTLKASNNAIVNTIFTKASHDPAPLSVGLPCYVSRADDSNGLPK